MSLWKIFKCACGKQSKVDVNQLKERLQVIAKQNNAEIMQLAIQSILEELSEEYRIN